MRHFYSIGLFLLGFGATTSAQPSELEILLFEPVMGDPLSLMLTAPTGADDVWVNFDMDEAIGFCVEGDDTPLGWFVERDFGFPSPEETDNDAFTSCSYLSGAVQNHNWLILPPIQIPDSSFQLCWRSLITEGPAYVDGYKVVASRTSNLPSSGDFTETLFTAAETIAQLTPGPPTIQVQNYLFSPGYLHANGFTDTNYYYLVTPAGPICGRLEPHCVSLAAFAGQTIYLAFHHDSTDDSKLQLDDIVVNNDIQVSTQQPSVFTQFTIVPNPVSTQAYVQWGMKKPEAGVMRLMDVAGKTMLEQHFDAYEKGQLFLDLTPFAAGVYQCSLQTATGNATRKLVKL